ncbi:outer membrane protein [Helicobacter cetorum]|uniref:Putative outer membrane protein, putative signal peptide n=1 Tax=Helicobacter cetorum (strain ATCC BAA-540 / CCUG 52418 / MIT 99-5656) TaxID=1163745 RepID=I0ERF1_HELCM|nr:outer membrane protein [Helicobacter cetorum]AFI05520.1 putative outer membrane protein, putative signal peptide [Helicobacter cetorum MIT 99-5656]
MNRTLLLALIFSCILGAKSFEDTSSKNNLTPIKRYADKNAFYMGLGYQLGSVSKNQTDLDLIQQFISTPITGTSSPTYQNIMKLCLQFNPAYCKGSQLGPQLGIQPFVKAEPQAPRKSMAISNGFGLALGYKIVGKNKSNKWLGARFGVFYDQTFSTYSQGSYFSSLTKQQNSNIQIFTYGVHADLLLNAINNEKFFTGFNLGVALAGVSYQMRDEKVYQAYLNRYFPNKLTTNAFQFLFNVGMRLGDKHNSFEFGVKIPVIESVYLQAKNTNNSQTLDTLVFKEFYSSVPYKITFKRDFALYFNYIYSF